MAKKIQERLTHTGGRNHSNPYHCGLFLPLSTETTPSYSRQCFLHCWVADISRAPASEATTDEARMEPGSMGRASCLHRQPARLRADSTGQEGRTYQTNQASQESNEIDSIVKAHRLERLSARRIKWPIELLGYMVTSLRLRNLNDPHSSGPAPRSPGVYLPVNWCANSTPR